MSHIRSQSNLCENWSCRRHLRNNREVAKHGPAMFCTTEWQSVDHHQLEWRTDIETGIGTLIDVIDIKGELRKHEHYLMIEEVYLTLTAIHSSVKAKNKNKNKPTTTTTTKHAKQKTNEQQDKQTKSIYGTRHCMSNPALTLPSFCLFLIAKMIAPPAKSATNTWTLHETAK